MIVSTSPQQPDLVLAEVTPTSPAAVAATAVRARQAQRDWAHGGPAARAAALAAAADALDAAAEELTALVVAEVGKPRTEARGEVARAVAILRYYAQQAYDPLGATHDAPGDTLTMTTRRPRGVAGLITPWNFPLAIPVWKAAPALAYGNAVLLKPAEEATACGLRLGELLAPLLPDGVFTVLPGAAETGQALLGCADVVSFTGSTEVGRAIVTAAAGRGVPVQAEMGGQNPAIVLPDADPAVAAATIAGAVAGYAGQKCTATKRVIVVGDATRFTDALVDAIDKLPIGDPADAATVVGPVIDAAARQRILDAASSVAAAGGRILTSARAPEESGWYVAPTLADSLPRDHLLERDEVFGPICAISTVGSLDEAIGAANDVAQGLVAGIYTNDLSAALQAANSLAVGMVKVNAPTAGVDFYLPFGGVKDSGYGGKEQGKAALEVFTSSHTLTIAPA
jgi:acyl-CoA reductase-like NAD-dependent aldehyde dehydrogenase